MKPIVAISIGFGYYSLKDAHANALKEQFPEYEFLIKPFEEIDEELFPRIEVVFGNPPKTWMKNLPNLRYHQLVSAGADQYADHALYVRGDIILANGSGLYGQPISEHLLAMMLSFTRELHLFRDTQRSGVWRRTDTVPLDFAMSTVVVVGLGDIGGALAAKAKALGARVLAVKRTPGKKPPYVDELGGPEKLAEFLPQADFVALCLPNTPETARIITREMLFSMKSTSVLLNIGRGTAVDQEALIEALEKGVIGGAGLDVTDPEPLPSENPLWKMENVLISCHTAGRSQKNEENIIAIFTENMRRLGKSETLNNVVDFQLKY